MRKIILTALFILSSASARPQSSQQAPPMALKDICGRQFSLADYKGKVLLLNFWATWCPPCRTEIPDLIKMQTQYRDQGLRIIGITYPPEKISEVRHFSRKLKVNYRVVIGTKASKALFTSSDTLPLTVVIDREGAVRDVVEGIMYSDEFDQKVKPLLSINPPQPLNVPVVMAFTPKKTSKIRFTCRMVSRAGRELFEKE